MCFTHLSRIGQPHFTASSRELALYYRYNVAQLFDITCLRYDASVFGNPHEQGNGVFSLERTYVFKDFKTPNVHKDKEENWQGWYKRSEVIYEFWKEFVGERLGDPLKDLVNEEAQRC